ncbi:hypothetical protein CRUP_034600 [Coryphaenoides rupestris]|nr:hypothetical protein CRUP_034600 [Coryphaenoides rupestris]
MLSIIRSASSITCTCQKKACQKACQKKACQKKVCQWALTHQEAQQVQTEAGSLVDVVHQAARRRHHNRVLQEHLVFLLV